MLRGRLFQMLVAAMEQACKTKQKSYPFLEAKVCTDKHEGHGYAEPHGQERHQGREGDSGRALLGPEEEVENKDDDEDGSGNQETGQDEVGLPLLTTKR